MLFRGIAVAVVLPLLGCSGSTGGETAQEPITIQAWYNGALFTASYQEHPGSAPTQASTLYQSDPGIVAGGSFVSVLGGAIGNNVWREIQVSGNQCARGELCAAPRQFTSADEILA